MLMTLTVELRSRSWQPWDTDGAVLTKSTTGHAGQASCTRYCVAIIVATVSYEHTVVEPTNPAVRMHTGAELA
jgi:hypothetical protein